MASVMRLDSGIIEPFVRFDNNSMNNMPKGAFFFSCNGCSNTPTATGNYNRWIGFQLNFQDVYYIQVAFEVLPIGTEPFPIWARLNAGSWGSWTRLH